MQIQEQSQEQERTALPLPSAASTPPAVRSLESHGRYRFGLAYGRLVYRFRWIIIVLWLAGVAASVPFAARIGSVLSGGGYSYSGSDSVQVADMLTAKLHQPLAQLLVVFQASGTSVSDPAYQREVNDFMDRAQAFQHVTSVKLGGTGTDGATTYVTVSFDQGSQYVEQHFSAFRALLPSGADAGPARAYVTGEPAISAAFTQITQHDTERGEIAALPIALVILVLVFGTLVAALMPLLLAMVAVPVALAAIYFIALHTTTSTFVLNIASIIGLGISIDYSLFMTRRFRSELAEGRSPRDAIGWTIATAGEAILFSGLTVMIGFAALILIGVPFMQSFGIGGTLVVAAAVLASLTLLPALLGVLGPRINALCVPILGRHLIPTATEGAPGGQRRGFWQGLAVGVMRHPIFVVVIVGALLLGMGWPVLSINVGSPTSSALPGTAEARQGLDKLSAQFPAMSANPILIVAQTPDGTSILSRDNISRIDHLSQWLRSQPHVSAVISLTALPAATGAPAAPSTTGATPSATPSITPSTTTGATTSATPRAATGATPGATASATSRTTPSTTPNAATSATPGATPATTPSAAPGATPGTVAGTTPGAPTGATPGGGPLDEQQLAELYSTGAYQRIPALAQLVASTTADNATLITVMSSAPMDSADSKALVDQVRANTTQAQGLTVLVGGTQALTLDFTRYLYGNFPRAILFILVATYLLLLLMFRSLLLPLKAILMNVLSVSAAYGILVFIFQWGHFESFLGFHSAGVIDSFVPILMFCILFGLSMDYEVFLLSSVHEEWLRTHNNRWAVAQGLAKTGGVITNAAILFVIVTGAFAFATLTIIKEMGMGMAVAVLVDAFIIRTLLVPATMRLLGRWNWWLPGRPLPPKQTQQPV